MVYTSSTMQKVARWIALVPLFVIPFLALYVAGDLFFPFITGKAFFFRILVEIATAGWIVAALGDKHYRPKFSWTLLIYGVFVLWMLFADVIALNPHKAIWSNFERMDGWITIIHVFLFFIVASSMLVTEKLRTAWWRTFLIAVGLTCVVALLQVACAPNGCNIGGQVYFMINQGGLRVDSTFGNAIYFAVFLMFGLGITLWQSIISKGWLRYVLWVLAVFEVWFLLLSASRGALIATMGGLVFAALWSIWRAGPKGRGIAIGVLVALVVVLGGFFMVRTTPFVTEQPVVARLASIFSIEGELKTRFTIWHMALQGAAERPVAGWGQEGFNFVFAKYYDPSLYAVEPYYDRAHNTYLDWLIAGGIPALLLFLALMVMSARAILRAPLSSIERMTFLSLLVAYGIQALVVFDNLFTYIPLAMILVTAHLLSARPMRSFESMPIMPERGLGIVAMPVVTAAAVAVIWLVNVPNMTAAADLIRAQKPTTGGLEDNLALFKQALNDHSFASQEIREQLVAFTARVVAEPSVSVDLKEQYLNLALDGINQELERAPNDVRLLLQRAAVYRTGGDFPDALASINAAIAQSPKKQAIYIERGGTQWLAGDAAGAITSFTQAYQIDPEYKDPLIYLASTYVYANDLATANSILVQEFGTTTVDSDILWNAYAVNKQYEPLLVLQRLRVTNSHGDPSQRLLLAQILAISGQVDAARAEINGTILMHPEAAAQGQALLQQISAPASTQ